MAEPKSTRRIVRPTLRGGLFLGTGSTLCIVAWAVGQRDLLFVAGLLVLVPLLALVYVLVHPVRVSVSRTFRPGTVSAGLSATVVLQVRNRAATAVSGLRWRDTAAGTVVVPDPQPLRGLGPARPGRPAPTDTATLSYQVRPPRRGSYPIGPLMLGRIDPFGLAYSEWPVGPPHDLTVTPRVSALPGNGVSITTGEGSRHERLRHLNNDSDELIAREYRPGDPMRRVNWPATARHGEIMVRQEEQRSHPEARVLLDTTRGGAGPAAPDRMNRTIPVQSLGPHSAEFERAVELVASIAVHLLDAGFRVDAVELGPSQFGASQFGASQFGASQLGAPHLGTVGVPDRFLPGASRPSADPHAGRRGGLRGDDPVSFTGPEGERALLDALALVVQRDHPVSAKDGTEAGTGGPRGAGPVGGQVPTFAVLVDTGAGDTRDLVAFRPVCKPAVAFVFDTMTAAAIESLGEAGWQCVPVTALTSVETAWLQAGQDRGDRDDS